MASIANPTAGSGGGSGGGGVGGGHGYGGGGGGGGGSSDDPRDTDQYGFNDPKNAYKYVEQSGTKSQDIWNALYPGAQSDTMDQFTDPAYLQSLGIPQDQWDEVQQFVQDQLDVGTDPQTILANLTKAQQDASGQLAAADKIEGNNEDWLSQATPRFNVEEQQYTAGSGWIPGDDPTTTDTVERRYRDPNWNEDNPLMMPDTDPIAMLMNQAYDYQNPNASGGNNYTDQGFQNTAQFFNRILNMRNDPRAQAVMAQVNGGQGGGGAQGTGANIGGVAGLIAQLQAMQQQSGGSGGNSGQVSDVRDNNDPNVQQRWDPASMGTWHLPPGVQPGSVPGDPDNPDVVVNGNVSNPPVVTPTGIPIGTQTTAPPQPTFGQRSPWQGGWNIPDSVRSQIAPGPQTSADRAATNALGGFVPPNPDEIVPPGSTNPNLQNILNVIASQMPGYTPPQTTAQRAATNATGGFVPPNQNEIVQRPQIPQAILNLIASQMQGNYPGIQPPGPQSTVDRVTTNINGGFVPPNPDEIVGRQQSTSIPGGEQQFVTAANGGRPTGNALPYGLPGEGDSAKEQIFSKPSVTQPALNTLDLSNVFGGQSIAEQNHIRLQQGLPLLDSSGQPVGETPGTVDWGSDAVAGGGPGMSRQIMPNNLINGLAGFKGQLPAQDPTVPQPDPQNLRQLAGNATNVGRGISNLLNNSQSGFLSTLLNAANQVGGALTGQQPAAPQAPGISREMANSQLAQILTGDNDPLTPGHQGPDDPISDEGSITGGTIYDQLIRNQVVNNGTLRDDLIQSMQNQGPNSYQAFEDAYPRDASGNRGTPASGQFYQIPVDPEERERARLIDFISGNVRNFIRGYSPYADFANYKRSVTDTGSQNASMTTTARSYDPRVTDANGGNPDLFGSVPDIIPSELPDDYGGDVVPTDLADTNEEPIFSPDLFQGGGGGSQGRRAMSRGMVGARKGVMPSRGQAQPRDIKNLAQGILRVKMSKQGSGGGGIPSRGELNKILARRKHR